MQSIISIVLTDTFFCNKVFSQIIGIPIGTNCATLIADFESELMAKLQKNLSKQSLIRLFN